MANNLIFQTSIQKRLEFGCEICSSEVKSTFGKDGKTVCSNCGKSYTTTDLESVLDDKLTDKADSVNMFSELAKKLKTKLLDIDGSISEVQKLHRTDINKQMKLDARNYNNKTNIEKTDIIRELDKLHKSEYNIQKSIKEYKNGKITDEECYNKIIRYSNKKFKFISRPIDYYDYLSRDVDHGDLISNVSSKNPNATIHSVTSKSPSIRIKHGSKCAMMWGSGTVNITGVKTIAQAREYVNTMEEFIDGDISNDLELLSGNYLYSLKHGLELRQFFDIIKKQSEQFTGVEYEPEASNMETLRFQFINNDEKSTVAIDTKGGIIINTKNKNANIIVREIKRLVQLYYEDLKSITYNDGSEGKQYIFKSNESREVSEELKRQYKEHVIPKVEFSE